ncbi:MAG: low molecular weight protein-tyrosine-phosphatase [Phycisphaerales bacterium]
MSMSGTRPSKEPVGVLFVCLGNICRSPLAKALFIHYANEEGTIDRFDIDSCGTGDWHVGQDADPRTISVAIKNALPFSHIARTLDHADFDRFHLILAMDHANRRTLLSRGAPKDRVHLMRSFDPRLKDVTGPELDVPDPYYGGESGFDLMYDMLRAATRGLHAHLMR